uniref:Uncharacterized protein n=1 Tax=Rhizophora mucronata TaxID=61149 RepID=A0A2P2PQU7_RHIMU
MFDHKNMEILLPKHKLKIKKSIYNITSQYHVCKISEPSNSRKTTMLEWIGRRTRVLNYLSLPFLLSIIYPHFPLKIKSNFLILKFIY